MLTSVSEYSLKTTSIYEKTRDQCIRNQSI